MLTAASSATVGTTTAPASLLIGHIQAHIKQGDAAKERATKNIKKSQDHYIAAGQYLKMLKVSYAPTWQQWETVLKVKVKLSTGRASELMQLADGRKSLQEIRDEKAQSVRQLRAQKSSLQGRCSEEIHVEVPSTPPSPEPSTLPKVRDAANRLIDFLINETVRELAIKMVLEGERQNAFDYFRDAIADIYKQLSRVRR